MCVHNPSISSGILCICVIICGLRFLAGVLLVLCRVWYCRGLGISVHLLHGDRWSKGSSYSYISVRMVLVFWFHGAGTFVLPDQRLENAYDGVKFSWNGYAINMEVS